MNICISVFFPLSYKNYNKLDEYIYTYFFIILIILLNNFFYNKDRCLCHLKKATNIYLFTFNQNQNFIKKKYRSYFSNVSAIKRAEEYPSFLFSLVCMINNL